MASIEVYQYGAAPQVIEALEGTVTQTFAIGDLLMWEAAGRVVVATTGNEVAIARKAATGTADTKLQIELLDPVTLYVAKAASGTTTNQTNVGELGTFTFTIGGHTLAANTTSGADASIVQLHPADGAKAGGRYIIRFLASAIDMGV